MRMAEVLSNIRVFSTGSELNGARWREKQEEQKIAWPWFNGLSTSIAIDSEMNWGKDIQGHFVHATKKLYQIPSRDCVPLH